MRPFNNPPMRPRTTLPFVLPFLAPAEDDRLESRQPNDMPRFLKVVSQIQAQPDGAVIARPCAHRLYQRLGHQLHVMPIGRCHCHRQRHARRVNKHAAFDATFGAAARVGTCFSPHSDALVIAPSSASQLQPAWRSSSCSSNPQNLNIVRKIAMNLLRLNPLKKTLPKKRLRACLDLAYLAQVPGVAAWRDVIGITSNGDGYIIENS